MNTQTGTETNVLSRSAPWAFLNDKTQPSRCGLGICACVFFTLIFHVPEPQLKQNASVSHTRVTWGVRACLATVSESKASPSCVQEEAIFLRITSQIKDLHSNWICADPNHAAHCRGQGSEGLLRVSVWDSIWTVMRADPELAHTEPIMLLSIWAVRWRRFNLQTMRFKQKLFNSSREMPHAFLYNCPQEKNVIALFMGKLHLSCFKNMKDNSRLRLCGARCL